MFTSFHHFPPKDARAILQNAVDAGESIGIFEATKRSPSTIGLIFVGILLMFLHTPRIRPFRWSRLLWTYLIPVIPLGPAIRWSSFLPAHLPAAGTARMVEKLTSCEYQWEIGELATGRMPVTYLIGYPKSRPVHLTKNCRGDPGLRPLPHHSRSSAQADRLKKLKSSLQSPTGERVETPECYG